MTINYLSYLKFPPSILSSFPSLSSLLPILLILPSLLFLSPFLPSLLSLLPKLPSSVLSSFFLPQFPQAHFSSPLCLCSFLPFFSFCLMPFFLIKFTQVHLCTKRKDTPGIQHIQQIQTKDKPVKTMKDDKLNAHRHQIQKLARYSMLKSFQRKMVCF